MSSDEDKEVESSLRNISNAKRCQQVRSDASSTAGKYVSNMQCISHDTGPVPSIGQLLNDFKVPERPRLFKSEPIDDETWKTMLALNNSKKKRRPRYTETRGAGRMVDEQVTEDQVRHLATNHLRNEEFRNSGDHKIVVDLTDENHSINEPQHQQSRSFYEAISPTVNQPKCLTASQVKSMDQLKLPDAILQQAREIYRCENVLLPSNVTNWLHLKAFVAQHQNSFITPQLCSLAQAHSFRTAIPSTSLQHNIPTHNTRPSNLTSTRPSLSADSDRDGFLPFNDLEAMHSIKIEEETQRQEQSHLSTAQINTPSRVSLSYADYTHLKFNGNQSSPSTKAMEGIVSSPYGVAQCLPKPLTMDQIQGFSKPSDLMSNILPPNAPEDCPHLVKIWEPCLLTLPKHQHRHLNLRDTIVSVLARYDIKTKSTIRAFLDVAETHHFYFLLQAKECRLHSWSVERENDIITVSPAEIVSS